MPRSRKNRRNAPANKVTKNTISNTNRALESNCVVKPTPQTRYRKNTMSRSKYNNLLNMIKNCIYDEESLITTECNTHSDYILHKTLMYFVFKEMLGDFDALKLKLEWCDVGNDVDDFIIIKSNTSACA